MERALRLWLEALGHRVMTIEGGRYAVPPEVGTVLLLAPSEPLEPNTVSDLEQWVRGGGRLVVADESPARLGPRGASASSVAIVPEQITRAAPTAEGRLDPQIGAVAPRRRSRSAPGGARSRAAPGGAAGTGDESQRRSIVAARVDRCAVS